MAERDELQKQYAYSEMSSKVVQGNVRRQRGEPTGEVEALRPDTAGRMGDRVERKAKKPRREETVKSNASSKPTKNTNDTIAVLGETILDLGNLTGYQPSTEQARAAYENILVLLADKLGNQGPAFLRDAAEEVILTLKDQNIRDPERREILSKLLTGKGSASDCGLSVETFSSLVQFGKQLDDYDKKEYGKDVQVDDEMGVAVVFDEDSDEAKSDSDMDENVVVDPSSDEEEEVVNARESEIDDDEEKVVQGGAEQGKKTRRHLTDRVLSVFEIDAHFLQRQLSKHFEDAEVSAKMASDVLKTIDIRNETDIRECENSLLVLLGFDHFETIKLILHNRVRVWACISIKRAQSEDERNLIKDALLNERTGEGKRVWDELNSKGKAEDWTRDRMRGAAAGMKVEGDDVSRALDKVGSHAMKEGDDMPLMEVESGVEKTELDLEGLAFADGAHTMSNKQCDLPDTSWRAMKKGYEEVHVPAVRSVISKDEELVKIKDLPTWTHAAFHG
jgi:pre-mRNA-splicing helicase BRR2